MTCLSIWAFGSNLIAFALIECNLVPCHTMLMSQIIYFQFQQTFFFIQDTMSYTVFNDKAAYSSWWSCHACNRSGKKNGLGYVFYFNPTPKMTIQVISKDYCGLFYVNIYLSLYLSLSLSLNLTLTLTLTHSLSLSLSLSQFTTWSWI